MGGILPAGRDSRKAFNLRKIVTFQALGVSMLEPLNRDSGRALARPLSRVRGCHFSTPSLILSRFGSLAATSAWACLT